MELKQKLSFGLMRLPLKNKLIQTAVDHAAFCEMADAFLAAGYRHFDTSIVYHGGASETAFRDCVAKRHPRDSFTITDKMPMFLIKHKSMLEPTFKKELANYIPRYLGILLDAKMNDKIKELRIEGHTDNVPYPQLDPDPYYANLILSQRRALSVMQYIRSLPEYQQYSKDKQDLLEYWFTANGMSYGRALDDYGELTHKSTNGINKSKSRRVEIRLITAGDEMLEEFVENNK